MLHESMLHRSREQAVVDSVQILEPEIFTICEEKERAKPPEHSSIEDICECLSRVGSIRSQQPWPLGSRFEEEYDYLDGQTSRESGSDGYV